MYDFNCISKMRFPAKAYQLKEIRCVVGNAMHKVGCIQETTDKIIIAINEACMNIIQHAYCEQPNGEIIVEILHNRNDLLFRITDFAAPIDPTKIKPRDLSELRPGGLGVNMMREIMDDIAIRPLPDNKGNITEMRISFKRNKHS